MASLVRRSLKITLSPSRQAVFKRFHSSQSGEGLPSNKNPPGLSRNVVSVPDKEVGPGASKSSVYKNPEYFCYNQSSFFEAEVELQKYRLPQPSSKQTPSQ